jgi:hypothetical protein
LPQRGAVGRAVVRLAAVLVPGGLHLGVVDPVGGAGAAAVAGLAQAQVDHPGDGVRAVLRGRAFTQDLDGLQGGGRDGVEVERRRAAADRAVDVDEGGGVGAVTVQQHQGLVGRKAAQGGGTHRVGAVGHRRAREVERRGQIGQGLGQFRRALLGQGLVVDDVDRRDGIEPRTRDAGAGDDDLVDRGRIVGGRGRVLSMSRAGDGRRPRRRPEGSF